jgi:hypothetical protein
VVSVLLTNQGNSLEEIGVSGWSQLTFQFVSKRSYFHTFRYLTVELVDILLILIEHLFLEAFLKEMCDFLLLLAYVPVDCEEELVDSFPDKFTKSSHIIRRPYKSPIDILIDSTSGVFLKSHSKISLEFFIFPRTCDLLV